MEEQKKEYERNPKSYNHYYQEYVRTQRLSKFIDEDINPGDYIVRELGGEYYVGRVVELSPNFYRYKVLNAFPLGEGGGCPS